MTTMNSRLMIMTMKTKRRRRRRKKMNVFRLVHASFFMMLKLDTY